MNSQMKRTLLVVLTLAFALSSVLAHAKGGRKFGTAGCGLGSMIFNDQGGMIQVLAATTNGTSYSQTFGISSGTSNCESAEESAMNNKQLPLYVEVNQNALSKDIARGSGDTLVGLAHVMGCKDSAQLGTVLRQNYTNVFSNAAASKSITNEIVKTVKSDASLSRSCAIAG